MLLFCHQITNRLRYIAQFLFDENIVFTNDETYYTHASDSCKINYSYKPLINQELWIFPANILFENQLPTSNVKQGVWQDEPTIFHNNQGSIPFDFLAASFYLITRSEEYDATDDSLDEHGRFKAACSIAAQGSFLHKPIIDIWLQKITRYCLTNNLWSNYSNNLEHQTKIDLQLTYDVDECFLITGKPLIKIVKEFAGDVIHKRYNYLQAKWNSITEHKQDDYDLFNELHHFHQSHQVHATFFLLALFKQNAFDRNGLITNATIQACYKTIAQQANIGIHPSYHTNQNLSFFNQQKQALEALTKQTIINCRFHYLRFQIPASYSMLLEAGITNDYSMGYATDFGYRASTSKSFYWFNMLTNQQTSLKIHPFYAMDATAYFYKKLNIDELLHHLKQQVYSSSFSISKLCVIMHNHLFIASGSETFQSLEKYKQFITEVVNKK